MLKMSSVRKPARFNLRDQGLPQSFAITTLHFSHSHTLFQVFSHSSVGVQPNFFTHLLFQLSHGSFPIPLSPSTHYLHFSPHHITPCIIILLASPRIYICLIISLYIFGHQSFKFFGSSIITHLCTLVLTHHCHILPHTYILLWYMTLFTQYVVISIIIQIANPFLEQTWIEI